jgi:Ran GTPase-activating protein (RanGAP) involved in mRNA processing and transport
LDLHDNFFQSNASHEALFRTLQATTCLVYLDLGLCELKDDGIKKVCLALFACSLTLEHLDLSGNYVTRHGAKHIADYIRDCGGNLKALRLEDNQELTSIGVEIIASAFHGSEAGNNIEEIQLNKCLIGAIGARALIAAFGPNGNDLPKLKHIFLNDNSFSDDILSKLQVAFNYRLGELDLNDSDSDADDKLSEDEEEEEEEDAEKDVKEEDLEPVADSVDDLAEVMDSWSSLV